MSRFYKQTGDIEFHEDMATEINFIDTSISFFSPLKKMFFEYCRKCIGVTHQKLNSDTLCIRV